MALQDSFIQAISIAPIQFHYYSEALPTKHRQAVVSQFHAAAPQATAIEELAQDPNVAVRAEFEPATLRTKNAESTSETPRSKIMDGKWGSSMTFFLSHHSHNVRSVSGD